MPNLWPVARPVGVSGTKLPRMVTDRHVSPLAGFGVGARAERLYRFLLRRGVTSFATLAGELDWPAGEVATQLRTLVNLNLVTVDGDQASTTAPHLALGRLVEQEAEALARREHELEALRSSIRDYAAEERGHTDGPGNVEPIEVHSGPEVAHVVNSLIRSTTGTLMMVHPEEWLTDPAWSKSDSLLPLETQGGRPARGIYPTAVIHDPEAIKTVRWFADVGEEVRLMPRPPSRLLIFGRDAVLVPVEWGRKPVRRIVIRTPGVVDAFVLLFEMLWRMATPLVGQTLSQDREPSADATRSQILRMLAVGAKDETMARQLGLSLRTVRRRVAEVMSELGAATRFQAGVEAVRRRIV